MSHDIWYEHRTPEGVALIGSVFLLEYHCVRPFTKKMNDFYEAYIRPAAKSMADDIERGLYESW